MSFVRQVASHPQWTTSSNAKTDVGRSTRLFHVALCPFTEPVLVYINPSANAIKIRASIEYGAETYFPVHFTGEDGNRDIEIPAGATVESLPVAGISVPKGAHFWSNTLVQKIGTNYWAAERYGNVNNVSVEKKAGQGNQRVTEKSVTDYTASLNPGTEGLTQGLGPQRISGQSTEPPSVLVGLVGDSIATGTNDKTNGGISESLPSYETGYVVRKIGGRLPYYNLSQNGEAGRTWYENPETIRAKLLREHCSHIFWEYITNDLGSGSVHFSEIREPYIKAWYQLGEKGAKLYATTCTPRTTSKTSEEPLNSNFGPEAEGNPSDRQEYNEWLRDGAPVNVETKKYAAKGSEGATVARCTVYGTSAEVVKAASGPAGHPLGGGVVDVAAVVEKFNATTKTWVYKSTEWTPDGIHPSELGHTEIAKAVPEPEATKEIVDLEAALTGAGSLAAALGKLASLSLEFGGSGVLASSLVPRSNLAPSLTGVGQVFVSFDETTAELGAALAGTGSVSALMTVRANLAATLSGGGPLDAALTPIGDLAPSLAAEGALLISLLVGPNEVAALLRITTTPARFGDVGGIAGIRGEFLDPSTRELLEPEEVTCLVRAPNGYTHEIAFTGEDGVYLGQAELTEPGRWIFAVDGGGDILASHERAFLARAQQVTR